MVLSTRLQLVLAIVLFVWVTSAHAQDEDVYYARIQEPFTDLRDGKVEWVDLDNDGDLDYVHCGKMVSSGGDPDSFVLENVNATFTMRTTGLPKFGIFAFGDYDKDGDQDVLVGTDVGSTGSVKLYRNEGGFNFTLRTDILNLFATNIVWIDIDKDQDLDFIVTGYGTVPAQHATRQTVAYENTPTGFAQLNSGLPACQACAINAVDANGDGWTDVMFTGSDETSLYLNEGDKSFTKFTNNPPFRQLRGGDTGWADFDGDGDLDFAITGRADERRSFIYENNGRNFIERTDISLEGFEFNSIDGVVWFNYDNNELPDLLLGGKFHDLQTGNTARIYKNIGGGSFTSISDGYVSFDALSNPSYDPGDVDNDGDMDLAYGGSYYYLAGMFNPSITSRPASGYYKHMGIIGTPVANDKPQPPPVASFSSSSFRDGMYFAWDPGTDDKTPAAGLAYNFYLRSNTSMIVAPDVNISNGYRLTDNAPNGWTRKGYVKGAPEGEVFLAVQSIDGVKAGSVFSAEKSFFHFNGPEITRAEIIDDQHIKLNWIDHSSLETSFEVSLRTSPAPGFNVVGNPAQNVTTFTHNATFAVEALYYYRLKSTDGVHVSPLDSIMVVIPARTTNLVTETINSEKIKLTWQDNSDYETGYEIERKKSTESEYVGVAMVPKDTLEFIDRGLLEGITYNYRVKSVNRYGGLAPTQEVSATTNKRPSGNAFKIEVNEDDTVHFKPVDFARNFVDPNDTDEFKGFKIQALPLYGKLYVGGKLAKVGDEIAPEKISAMEFRPDSNFADETALWVYAYDGKDYGATEWTVIVKFNEVNDPPLFGMPWEDLKEDFVGEKVYKPFVIDLPFEGTENVTYTLTPESSSLVNLTFDKATGTIKVTAIKNNFGKEEFTLTANDGKTKNNISIRKLTLTVASVPDIPTMDIIKDIEVMVGEEIPPIDVHLVNVDRNTSLSMVTTFAFRNEVVRNENIKITLTPENSFLIKIIPEKFIGETNVIFDVNHPAGSIYRTFKVKVILNTGLDDTMSGIDIYPNPFSERINVRGLTGSFNATIFDCLGRGVKNVTSTGETVIETSDLAAGIYFLSLSIDGNVIQKKIVRNK